MVEHGIDVVETPVGDRYVLDALDVRRPLARRRAVGPRDLPDLATTGDGLLTAVQLLDVVQRRGRTLRSSRR